ncbi:MAG: NusA-like transcription termination signal-binding factor [Nitrososphaerota archaeon]
MTDEEIKLTEREMRLVSLFQSYTGATVLDCLADDEQVVFLVREGEFGRAVGKRGVKVQELSSLLKKKLKVVEYHGDAASFLSNAVKPAKAQEVKIIHGKNGRLTAVIKVAPEEKAMVIGKGGRNVIMVRRMAKRHFNIERVIIE